MSTSDMLDMSDEDFLKLSAPPEVVAPATTTEEQPTTESVVSQAVTEETQPATEEVTPPVVEAEPAATVVAAEEVVEPVPAPAPVVENPPAVVEEESKPFDYKSAYEDLLKPIRANGKEIKLNSVQELIQLAQQGANYTKKMQEFAPHRKTAMMLKDNNIDEEQLSYLIDLSKKDPTAIQKLLKDSAINPLDLDVEAESTYQGGNHRVTDEEADFRTAIDDATQSDSGKVVLQAINSSWDQASKNVLFTQPAIIETMIQQQEAGFYDRINSEIDRRRTLGILPMTTPFLHAYKLVGDQMVAAGQLQDLVDKAATPVQTAPEPVAVRVAPVKPVINNDPRAVAAAPSRTTSSTAKTLVNPLEMDDSEFMKQFSNR